MYMSAHLIFATFAIFILILPTLTYDSELFEILIFPISFFHVYARHTNDLRIGRVVFYSRFS